LRDVRALNRRIADLDARIREEVEGVPEADGVEDQAQGGELVLLPLAQPPSLLRPFACRHCVL